MGSAILRSMNTAVYVRKAGEGIALAAGAEIIEAWEGGCLIRSEERLESPPGVTYYVAEGNDLVAVKFPPSEADAAPFDYPAEMDRSDTRTVVQGTGASI
jgi:hypothetical protein